MDGLFTIDMLPVSSTPPSKVRTRAKARRNKPVDRSTEWPLEGSINVVLFAGMGGACQGLEDAGFPVHLAVNHDEIAIAAHKALNPFTKHLQADIYEVDPLEATGGRHVGNLWGSPDCTDHSVAKGGAPRSPRVRSMPWQLCRWVGVLRKRGLGPEVGFLENVREIRGWNHLVAKRDPATGRVLKLDGSVAAPGERVPVWEQQLVRNPRKFGKPKRDSATGRLLVKDGRHMVRVAAEGERVPDSKRVRDRLRTEGRLYRAWKRHMERLGAVYEDRDLCCANYGVPTSRKRLFGVLHFDGRKPEWPEQTHASRKELVRLNEERAAAGQAPLQPHRAAAEIIDWSLDLPSIFDRPKDLAPATQKRIAVGMQRFVLNAKEPFLIHLTHGGRLHDIGDAGPTMTCAHRGEVALVGPALIPTTHSKSPARAHDGGGATPTLTAAVKGGEFAVMGAAIVGAGGRAAQVPPMDPAKPLNASTTKEDRCIVAAHVTTFRNGAVGHGMDESTRTFTAQHSDHHPGGAPSFGLVAASLVGIAHGDDSRSGSRVYDAEDAMRTATGSNDQAVMAAHLLRYHGERREGEARGVVPEDSLPTNTTENRFGIVGATLAPSIMTNNTNNVGAAVDEAVPALTTGNRDFVVAAHLTKFQENSPGQSADAPTDTMMAGAARFGVVGAFLEQHNTRDVGRPADDPLAAQTAKEHSAVIGAALVQTGYGERDGQAPRALDVEDAIGTQVAGAAKHAVVGAWMVQHNNHTKPNGESDVHNGHSVSNPVSAMTTTVSHQQVAGAYLVHQRGTGVPQDAGAPISAQTSGGDRGGSHHQVTAAYLSEYYGTGGQHQPVDAPLNALPTVDRFAVHGADVTAPPLPPEKLARARQVAAFLRAHGVWDDREFVTFGPWIVVDIGMRMLRPREAAAAHELRMPDLITVYKRDRKGNIVIGPDGKPEMVTRPLTKTEAMRLVGNSVPKRMAMLLAQANAVHALHAPSRQMQAAE
ncbi:DNA cytosine methyltransferase [Azospirillum himalayense]|uniref:DNA cytosine methyltransferase n=1 Tax=Azospirillum himalayense TaxID=654847 RepID=A0ABW0GBL6_9PROT